LNSSSAPAAAAGGEGMDPKHPPGDPLRDISPPDLGSEILQLNSSLNQIGSKSETTLSSLNLVIIADDFMQTETHHTYWSRSFCTLRFAVNDR
jgi:hypothetical protein